MLYSVEFRIRNRQMNRIDTTFTNPFYRMPTSKIAIFNHPRGQTSKYIDSIVVWESTLSILKLLYWILTTNFTFLVSNFALFLTFFLVALHLHRIFPQVCTKILLLSASLLVPAVCGVYSIVAMCSVYPAMPYEQCFDFHHRQMLFFERRYYMLFLV